MLSTRVYIVLCLLDIRWVFTVPEAEISKNYCATNSGLPEVELRFWPQSTHRTAMGTFWRKFHHDGKISPAWCGWRVHGPPPFTLSTITSKVVVYVSFSWEGRYTPLFLLYPYMYSMILAISHFVQILNRLAWPELIFPPYFEYLYTVKKAF